MRLDACRAIQEQEISEDNGQHRLGYRDSTGNDRGVVATLHQDRPRFHADVDRLLLARHRRGWFDRYTDDDFLPRGDPTQGAAGPVASGPHAAVLGIEPVIVLRPA